MVSQPLYELSDKLTLVEIHAEYEEILRQRFPKAEVLINSINNIQFDQKFDAIMLAHVLYFFAEHEWPGLINRLLSDLHDNGELFIVIWDNHFICDLFLPKVNKLNSVTPMTPVDQLSAFLRKFAKLEVIEVPTKLYIEDDEHIIYLVSHMLGVEDRTLVQNCKSEIKQFNDWLVMDQNKPMLETRNIIYRLSK